MKFRSKSFNSLRPGNQFQFKKILRAKWFKRTLWIVGIFLVLNYSIAFIANNVARVMILEFMVALTPHAPMDGVNILAFGIDETESVQRSDSIMLFHLGKNNNRISVLSIPRDTRVQIEKHGMSKINHAYAYGGPELLKRTTEKLLGIPIDHYLQLNLKGVETIIDELGGLSLTVEKELKYEDFAAGLSIDVSEGNQTLTGKQAIQYLRFRQDSEGDLGRIRRQQNFLQATAGKMGIVGGLVEFPSLLMKLNDSFSTDMSAKEIMGLSSRFLFAYKHGKVEIGTIPGNIRLIDGISYWKPDIQKLEVQVAKLVVEPKSKAPRLEDPEVAETVAVVKKEVPVEETPAPIIEETPAPVEPKAAAAAKMTPAPVVAQAPVVKTKPIIKTPDAAATKEDRRLITHKEVNRIISVGEVTSGDTLAIPDSLVAEVLNGTGQPKIAMRAAKRLKSMNLRIKRYSNAGSFDYAKTMIVDWKGQPEKSLAIAQSLGIPPENIIIYDRPDKPLDLTIVLGRDWKTYFATSEGN